MGFAGYPGEKSDRGRDGNWSIKLHCAMAVNTVNRISLLLLLIPTEKKPDKTLPRNPE